MEGLEGLEGVGGVGGVGGWGLRGWRRKGLEAIRGWRLWSSTVKPNAKQNEAPVRPLGLLCVWCECYKNWRGSSEGAGESPALQPLQPLQGPSAPRPLFGVRAIRGWRGWSLSSPLKLQRS